MIEEIDFDNRSGNPIDPSVSAYISQAVRTACSFFAFDAGYQVSVSYVNEQEIRELHAQYRKVDSFTDVPSFPMEDTDARGVALLGDIVLCMERAAGQAEEFGHSLERELSYLSVHSVLH